MGSLTVAIRAWDDCERTIKRYKIKTIDKKTISQNKKNDSIKG
jgi:hypothetical protein